MTVRAELLWRLCLALVLGVASSLLGCRGDDSPTGSAWVKNRGKSREKKRADPSSDTVDASAGGQGSYGLDPSEFDWGCATHPEHKQSIHLPKTGEHNTQQKEVARLARNLLLELTEPAGIGVAVTLPIFVEPSIGELVVAAIVLTKNVASFSSGQRVLLFSPEKFVQHVKHSATTDVVAFVFAHQMGHRVLGHQAVGADSGNPSAELEADAYAGWLLGKRGVSLLNSTTWMRNNVPIVGGKSLPGRAQRLASVMRGWKKGCAEFSKCDARQTLPDISSPDTSNPASARSNPKTQPDRKNQ